MVLDDVGDVSACGRDERGTVRDVYEALAPEYDERIPGAGPSDGLFTAAEYEFVLGRVSGGESVLDMGCGTGRFTVPLASKGVTVTGLDMSGAMLGEARRKLSAAGLTADLHEGDMAQLPFEDNSFDVVVSMLALMHVPLADRPKVFAEARRVLKPGGRLLIGVKNSLSERLFKGDRFAAVDWTDVSAKTLHFTQTRSGVEYVAPWYSFSPAEIRRLCLTHGLAVVELRGNSTLSAWIADEVLNDPGVAGVVQALDGFLGQMAPFNELGYHLLVEAVRPQITE